MKRFKDLKIATRLSIIFTAVAMGITLGLGYLVIGISTQNLIAQIKERYTTEAKDHMATIDIIMDRNYHHIQSFAQNEVLTQETSTPEEMTAILKKRKEIYGYVSLSYFDMNRIRIADTEGLHLGEQHQMVRYWQDVLAGKVSAGSDVRVAEELKIPVIYFASTVKNKDGKAIGVVVARFNPKAISDILEETKTKGVHATLFDKERNIIFSSCDELKDKVLKDKMPEATSIKLVLSGQDGAVLEYQAFHGREFFTGFAHEKGFEDFQGNDWSLVISVDKHFALAPVRRERNYALLYSGI